MQMSSDGRVMRAPIDSFQLLFSDKAHDAQLKITDAFSCGVLDGSYSMSRVLEMEIGRETTDYTFSFSIEEISDYVGLFKRQGFPRWEIDRTKTTAGCLCFLAGNVKCSASHTIPCGAYHDGVLVKLGINDLNTIRSVSYTARTETADARMLLNWYLLPPENTLDPKKICRMGAVELEWRYWEGDNYYTAFNFVPMHIHIHDIFRLAQLLGVGVERKHHIKFVDGQITLIPVETGGACENTGEEVP